MTRGGDGVSRRSFVVAGAATLASARLARAQTTGMTAQQVVARIKAGVGVPWRDTTVDTFKAGDPDTIVTGIATTAMATLSVLQRAAAAGRNLIIAHEPTFYAAADTPGARAGDPVYLAKKAFIDEHRLVIWRFYDHWLARQPNELAAALAETLGWTSRRDPNHERVYRIPSTTLGTIAAHVRTRLHISGGLRVIGSKSAPVERVVLSPGTTDLAGAVASLRDADLILSGEPREWEAVEYVADTAASGAPKLLIAIGRIVSEEPGMRACATWLRTLVREVPVEAIAMGDPYWRPAA
jgi:putative NIF3 family GTP cyclohydrolase 1 type 2